MNSEIKAVVLDVDGVIVGEKIGYNSPYPHQDVIKALNILKSKGTIVCFCTGKPYLAVEKIVKDADLYNLHITDGGAVLFDPITKEMNTKVLVPSKLAYEVIKMYIENSEYMEFYTPTDYFIQKSQKSEITTKHTHVLQKSPKIVSDLAAESLKHDITKVMVIAKNEATRNKPENLFNKYFSDQLNLRWGLHPVINPLQFGVITAKGISKGKMLLNFASEYSINTTHILAIGDSTSDWDFMKEAGYVASMENGSAELKQLVEERGEHGFIARHVDDNGFLDIISKFNL